MQNLPQKRSLWPYGLILTFAVFIGWIATFIGLAVRSSQDLVMEDYYEQEVRYQEQIDRESRTAPVGRQIAVLYQPAAERIEVRLPAAHAAAGLTGSVKWYRPSDASQDWESPLSVDAQGRQEFEAGGLSFGLWKLRITWHCQGEEFYADRSVILQPPSS